MKDIVSEICLYVQKDMEGASNELFVQGSHWPPTTVYRVDQMLQKYIYRHNVELKEEVHRSEVISRNVTVQREYKELRKEKEKELKD